MNIFLKSSDERLVVLSLFEGVDGFGELLDFLDEVFVFFCEEFVFFCEGFVVEFYEVYIDSHLLALENVLAFALELLSQEIVLLDDLFSIIMKISTLLFNFLDFLFEEGDLVLVGHEEGLDIKELLKHFGVVDLGDIFRGP